MSSTAPEAPGVPGAEFGAEHTNLPGSSEERETARSVHTTPDDSFIKHDAYYFKDGNVTFLVDGTLYCVHRYFFSRDSAYFSTLFSKFDIRDHEALPSTVPISDIERNHFEAFLSVLYPVNFGAYDLTYEQWKSVLHLSTYWGFTSLRELALRSITPPTSHDQLLLARTYSVDRWVLPALTALCERSLPLSLDEARQMKMGDVVVVARVREEIRGGAIQVGAADIRRYIEVAQADHPVGDDVQQDAPKNESAVPKLDSTVVSGIGPNVEAEMAETVTSPSESQRMGTKEGDTREGDVEHSSKEVPADTQGEDARRTVEQPHIVEGTPQDYLKGMATSAAQASGSRKSEDASREQPSAQLDVEAGAEDVRRLETEAAEEHTKVEEKARKEREEAARAKEEADAETKKTAMEAEARAKAQVAAKAKLEAEAEDRELMEALRAEIKAMIEEMKVEVKAEAASKAEAEAETEVRQAKLEADVRAKVDAKARDEAMAKEARDRKLKLLSPVTDAWGKIIECENCSNHAVGALHYCSQRYMKCDRCRRGRERFEFFRECNTCPGTPVPGARELSQDGGETRNFADYFY